MRTACGGVVANLVQAIVESEGDEWDVEVVPGRMGDTATDIVWKGWTEKEGESGPAKEDEDDELSDDDGEPRVEYVGGDLDIAGWDDTGAADWGGVIVGRGDDAKAGAW